MTEWYYADLGRQRQGPVSAAQLSQHLRQGLVQLDTLVWREGLGEWQPLHLFADELGLQPAPIAGTAPPLVSESPDSPYAPPAAILTRQPVLETGRLVVHAGFLKRLAASFLDGLLLTLVLLILLAIGIAATGIGFSNLAQDAASGAVAGALLLGIYVLPIGLQALYFTWMHASVHQATLGKRAVGIKVAQSNGQRIGNGRSLGRWAAYFFLHLFTCGLTSLVSAILVASSLRKQGLHDMVADTVVVDRWAFSAHPERQRQELGAVTVGVLVLMGLLVVAYGVGMIALMAVGAAQSS